MTENTGITATPMNWDDEIDLAPEFITLVPGKYDFTVISLDKERYDGGEKLPPCNVAKVGIKIDTEAGSSIIYHRFYLTTQTTGQISYFFQSIGMQNEGRIRMNWGAVIGKTGQCVVGNREYNGSVYNQVKKFVTPESDKKESTAAFAPGRF